MIDSTRTIGLDAVVSECTEILSPVFKKTAREEAFHVIADYLAVSLLNVRLDMDRIWISSEQKTDIILRINRRKNREPLQYIAGSAWFMGDMFLVGKEVLIPRPDTEILVEEALRIAQEIIPAEPGAFAFLEFCTGSGCIALSFVKKMKEAGFKPSGIATDISAEALSYATKNAQLLGCADDVVFIQKDLLTGDPGSLSTTSPASAGSFPMIFANPPYVRSDIIPALEPEVAAYEPSLALDGGPDGFLFYRRILEHAAVLLSPGGWLLLEIGFDQKDGITDMLQKTDLYDSVSIKEDYGGNPRVAIAKKKGGEHGRQVRIISL